MPPRKWKGLDSNWKSTAADTPRSNRDFAASAAAAADTPRSNRDFAASAAAAVDTPRSNRDFAASAAAAADSDYNWEQEAALNDTEYDQRKSDLPSSSWATIAGTQTHKNPPKTDTRKINKQYDIRGTSTPSSYSSRNEWEKKKSNIVRVEQKRRDVFYINENQIHPIINIEENYYIYARYICGYIAAIMDILGIYTLDELLEARSISMFDDHCTKHFNVKNTRQMVLFYEKIYQKDSDLINHHDVQTLLKKQYVNSIVYISGLDKDELTKIEISLKDSDKLIKFVDMVKIADLDNLHKKFIYYEAKFSLRSFEKIENDFPEFNKDWDSEQFNNFLNKKFVIFKKEIEEYYDEIRTKILDAYERKEKIIKIKNISISLEDSETYATLMNLEQSEIYKLSSFFLLLKAKEYQVKKKD